MSELNLQSSSGAEDHAAGHGVDLEEVYEAGHYREEDDPEVDGKILKKHVEAYIEDENEDEGDSYDVLNRHGACVRTFSEKRHRDTAEDRDCSVKELAEEYLEKHHPDGELRSPSVVPESKRV